MFSLKDLSHYKTVVLQCHDNPDADAIACAFALWRYFQKLHVAARIVYAGFRQISKPNLVEFVRGLCIPLEYVGNKPAGIDALAPDDGRALLITVDCQHGAGNVSTIKSDDVAVIDHHIQENEGFAYCAIEPYLGSCSTVVWKMLLEAGYDLPSDKDASTALYYGLFTDTNNFQEISHPRDRDMLESLSFDARFIKKLKSINLTREELLVAGKALGEAAYHSDQKNMLIEAEPCDPNILGFISDLTMQVENVETCVGFCRIGGGVKLSLRSNTYDVMANELAAYLTRGVGSGGGNKEKAGGFLKLPPEISDAKAFLSDRIAGYFSEHDKVVAGEHFLDLRSMRRYRKKPLTVGFVRLEDIYEKGTDVYVRTLEGDAAFTASPDTYLMVGIQGETYPIKRERFEKSYACLEGTFAFDPRFTQEAFYPPTVRDKLYERPVDLLPYIRPCKPLFETSIYARPVERYTKVFTQWYVEGYMLGKPGDYIAVRCDDASDAYIIEKNIFALTYEPEGA